MGTAARHVHRGTHLQRAGAGVSRGAAGMSQVRRQDPGGAPPCAGDDPGGPCRQVVQIPADRDAQRGEPLGARGTAPVRHMAGPGSRGASPARAGPAGCRLEPHPPAGGRPAVPAVGRQPRGGPDVLTRAAPSPLDGRPRIWYTGAIPGEFLIREVRADGTTGPAREARAIPYRDPGHKVRKTLAQYGCSPILCLSLPPAIPLADKPSDPDDVDEDLP